MGQRYTNIGVPWRAPNQSFGRKKFGASSPQAKPRKKECLRANNGSIACKEQWQVWTRIWHCLTFRPFHRVHPAQPF